MPDDFDDDYPLINRSAIVVTPTGDFVAWLKAVPGDPLELTLENVRDDSSVYLLPAVVKDEEAWLRKNYRPILEQELFNWCTDDSLWPSYLSFQTFNRLFRVSFHSMVYDLGKGPIEPETLCEE